MTNYIYGLGGRDITVANLKEIFTELVENAKAGKRIGAVQDSSIFEDLSLNFLNNYLNSIFGKEDNTSSSFDVLKNR